MDDKLENEVDEARRVVEVDRREVEVARREVEVARREVEVARREVEVARREVEVARREVEVAEQAVDEQEDQDEHDDEQWHAEVVRQAIAELQAGALELNLNSMAIGNAGAEALATVLATNTTLKSLCLCDNGIGTTGARALAAALATNATLTILSLHNNNIGAEGARSLAASLGNNATLKSLVISDNNIGAEGARALAAVLVDTNRTLQLLDLHYDGVTADFTAVKTDRIRVNRLAPKVAAWVASAAARRVELWDKKPVLAALAARAAVLAFGAELLDLTLPMQQLDLTVPELCVGASDRWLSPGGREFAAAYLMPLAHAALLSELERLVSPVTAPGQ
jgi:hypothetical protein